MYVHVHVFIAPTLIAVYWLRINMTCGDQTEPLNDQKFETKTCKSNVNMHVAKKQPS